DPKRRLKMRHLMPDHKSTLRSCPDGLLGRRFGALRSLMTARDGRRWPLVIELGVNLVQLAGTQSRRVQHLRLNASSGMLDATCRPDGAPRWPCFLGRIG